MKRELRPDDRRVVDALRAAGVEVESVYDLVNSVKLPRAAIGVLLDALPRVEDARIKEGIVRALAERKAGSDVARALIDEFLRTSHQDEQGPLLKWAIGNSLAEVADDSVLDEIGNLATDTRHGKSREMLALALGNMKSPRAEEILLGLLDDDVMTGHAVIGLGKLKSKRAEGALTRIAGGHPKAWVRKEAKRSLKKIRGARSSED